MKKNRRDFIRLAGMAGINLATARITRAYAFNHNNKRKINRVTLDCAKAILEDGSILATPYWHIESGRDGPSLLLVAAQHGHEVQGAEVARRFKEVCTRQLVSGNVWLIPMANLNAIRSRKHSIDLGPEKPGRYSEGHNMNRTWPGDNAGNDTARVSHALYQSIVRHCSHAVDLHCWNHFSAAATLLYKDHEPSGFMGDVTATRFFVYSNIPDMQRDTMNLRELINKYGEAAITIELSGHYQMRERQVETGLTSMVNIAIQLGMMEGKPELIRGPRAVRSPETSHEIFAPCSGIFMPALSKEKSVTLAPEDYVVEGQLLGHIISENDLETVNVFSPVSGYLFQYGFCHWNLCGASLPAQHPYAEMGDRIALIVKV